MNSWNILILQYENVTKNWRQSNPRWWVSTWQEKKIQIIFKFPYFKIMGVNFRWGRAKRHQHEWIIKTKRKENKKGHRVQVGRKLKAPPRELINEWKFLRWHLNHFSPLLWRDSTASSLQCSRIILCRDRLFFFCFHYNSLAWRCEFECSFLLLYPHLCSTIFESFHSCH